MDLLVADLLPPPAACETVPASFGALILSSELFLASSSTMAYAALSHLLNAASKQYCKSLEEAHVPPSYMPLVTQLLSTHLKNQAGRVNVITHFLSLLPITVSRAFTLHAGQKAWISIGLGPSFLDYDRIMERDGHLWLEQSLEEVEAIEAAAIAATNDMRESQIFLCLEERMVKYFGAAMGLEDCPEKNKNLAQLNHQLAMVVRGKEAEALNNERKRLMDILAKAAAVQKVQNHEQKKLETAAKSLATRQKNQASLEAARKLSGMPDAKVKENTPKPRPQRPAAKVAAAAAKKAAEEGDEDKQALHKSLGLNKADTPPASKAAKAPKDPPKPHRYTAVYAAEEAKREAAKVAAAVAAAAAAAAKLGPKFYTLSPQANVAIDQLISQATLLKTAASATGLMYGGDIPVIKSDILSLLGTNWLTDGAMNAVQECFSIVPKKFKLTGDNDFPFAMDCSMHLCIASEPGPQAQSAKFLRWFRAPTVHDKVYQYRWKQPHHILRGFFFSTWKGHHYRLAGLFPPNSRFNPRLEEACVLTYDPYGHGRMKAERDFLDHFHTAERSLKTLPVCATYALDSFPDLEPQQRFDGWSCGPAVLAFQHVMFVEGRLPTTLDYDMRDPAAIAAMRRYFLWLLLTYLPKPKKQLRGRPASKPSEILSMNGKESLEDAAPSVTEGRLLDNLRRFHEFFLAASAHAVPKWAGGDHDDSQWAEDGPLGIRAWIAAHEPEVWPPAAQAKKARK